MNAEESLQAGKLDDALAFAREAVRKSPADSRPRILLFQLLSVVGSWEKALTQLSILRDMDPDSMLLAEIFRPVIQCEALRAEIFSGSRSPMIFGEPEEWMGLLVQANHLIANGNFKAAGEIRERAFEAAPAVSGKINGRPFEWIADADTRLGPMLEAIISEKYFWVPFSRIQSAIIEAPADLRDLVWISARIIWVNGGNSPAFIPVRYPGSETNGDPGLRLARRTEWEERDAGTYIGLGQRILATDQEEVPLLEVRTLELTPASVPAEES
jgi:type VI secretion system protein ImpE